MLKIAGFSFLHNVGVNMDIPALCSEITIDAVENYLAHGRYHGDRTYGRPIAAEFEAFPSLILRF
jgi:hypothetical protein